MSRSRRTMCAKFSILLMRYLLIGVAASRFDQPDDCFYPQPNYHVRKTYGYTPNTSNHINTHLCFIAAALADVMQAGMLDIAILLKQRQRCVVVLLDQRGDDIHPLRVQ